jgi:hypothetical protein
MYFAFVGFNVVISANKRKVKKFVNNNFPGFSVVLGWKKRQTFANVSTFRESFGHSIIFDVDQKLKFGPFDSKDFRILPDYRNIFS